MTRYPLSTPLRVLRGGSDQEITATSDVMEMARTFSGAWLGTEEGTDGEDNQQEDGEVACVRLKEPCPMGQPP